MPDSRIEDAVVNQAFDALTEAVCFMNSPVPPCASHTKHLRRLCPSLESGATESY